VLDERSARRGAQHGELRRAKIGSSGGKEAEVAKMCELIFMRIGASKA